MTIVALLLEKEKQTYFAKVEPKVCWPEFCNEFCKRFTIRPMPETVQYFQIDSDAASKKGILEVPTIKIQVDDYKAYIGSIIKTLEEYKDIFNGNSDADNKTRIAKIFLAIMSGFISTTTSLFKTGTDQDYPLKKQVMGVLTTSAPPHMSENDLSEIKKSIDAATNTYLEAIKKMLSVLLNNKPENVTLVTIDSAYDSFKEIQSSHLPQMLEIFDSSTRKTELNHTEVINLIHEISSVLRKITLKTIKQTKIELLNVPEFASSWTVQEIDEISTIYTWEKTKEIEQEFEKIVTNTTLSRAQKAEALKGILEQAKNMY